jgi:protein tyrosine phosphatase (PTP) superfamily phosphohydrolase (DUF442 family)
MPKHRGKKLSKERVARSGEAAIQQPSRDKAAKCCIKSLRGDRTKVSEGPINDKSKGRSRCVTVWTVGHSTRPLDDFIALLQAHGIQRLVDVRTIPRSRHNPQFNQDQLPMSLESAGIKYVHMPALGGLRHAHRDSVNAAWQNVSFRGFADYMQTPEFDAALGELIRLARGRRTAIMCAEVVPWRCHRSLIADALVVRGLQVDEITGHNGTRPHTLTPWACVVGDRITYPAQRHKVTPTE